MEHLTKHSHIDRGIIVRPLDVVNAKSARVIIGSIRSGKVTSIEQIARRK